MADFIKLSGFNGISPFLLQMSFPWSRSSKAYETQGILGVLGVPLGSKTAKPHSEPPFIEKLVKWPTFHWKVVLRGVFCFKWYFWGPGAPAPPFSLLNQWFRGGGVTRWAGVTELLNCRPVMTFSVTIRNMQLKPNGGTITFWCRTVKKNKREGKWGDACFKKPKSRDMVMC